MVAFLFYSTLSILVHHLAFRQVTWSCQQLGIGSKRAVTSACQWTVISSGIPVPASDSSCSVEQGRCKVPIWFGSHQCHTLVCYCVSIGRQIHFRSSPDLRVPHLSLWKVPSHYYCYPASPSLFLPDVKPSVHCKPLLTWEPWVPERTKWCEAFVFWQKLYQPELHQSTD